MEKISACMDINCSPVSIRVGDHIVVKDVQVDKFGSFAYPVSISESAGEYRFTAYQTLADGTLIEASLPIHVPLNDTDEFEEPPEIPSISSNSYAASQLTSTLWTAFSDIFEKRSGEVSPRDLDHRWEI